MQNRTRDQNRLTGWRPFSLAESNMIGDLRQNFLYSAKKRLTALLPYFFLAVAPLCWAGNVVLARGVIHMIPPVSFAFWRWTIAFIVILPFTWRYVKHDWQCAVKSWKMMVLLSLMGISWFNTILYTAVHTTTAINAAMIQTVMPAVIILLSLVLFNERIVRLQILGVGLCIFGALLVIARGQWTTLQGLSFARGDIMMIGAVILYSLYSALCPRRPPIHPLSFLTITFGLGVLGLLPLYVWEFNRQKGFAVTPEVAASVLYVALFPSILAYLCWNRGIDLMGANRAGLFINLIPVFASILAILFLDEALAGYHLLGMILIFLGMILFNR
jgi:drug/metabolite transporter (DMT)-like permease